MAFEPPPTQAMSRSGRRFFLFQNLPPGFVADDALEIAHHERIGMRAVGGAEDVMRACGRW